MGNTSTRRTSPSGLQPGACPPPLPTFSSLLYNKGSSECTWLPQPPCQARSRSLHTVPHGWPSDLEYAHQWHDLLSKWIQGRRLHKPWKQTWRSLDREVQSRLEREYGLQWNTILAPCTPSPVGERCSVGWSDQGHLKQEALRVRVPLSLREGFLSKHIPKFHSTSLASSAGSPLQALSPVNTPSPFPLGSGLYYGNQS